MRQFFLLLFLSSRHSCLVICDDVLPALNTRSYVAHRAGNLVLFCLCIGMLLPSNGESMLDPFEDMEDPVPLGIRNQNISVTVCIA